MNRPLPIIASPTPARPRCNYRHDHKILPESASHIFGFAMTGFRGRVLFFLTPRGGGAGLHPGSSAPRCSAGRSVRKRLDLGAGHCYVSSQRTMLQT